MLNLEVSYKISRNLLSFEKIFEQSKTESKQETAFLIEDEIRDCINTSGHGTWNLLRTITKRWRKTRGNKPLSFLSNFVRHEIVGDKISVGFLQGKRVDQKFIDKYITSQEQTTSINISKGMRGYFAIRRSPLKSSTKTLTIPARPIIPLAFYNIQPDLIPSFSSKFVLSFERLFQNES